MSALTDYYLDTRLNITLNPQKLCTYRPFRYWKSYQDAKSLNISNERGL